MAFLVKFIKDDNGNVLLKKLDNTLITSFNPAQNLLRMPEQTKFKIQSVSSFATDPLILDYLQVDCANSVPAIVAVNFNEFLLELSKKFFFLDDDGSGGSINQNNYVRQLVIRATDLPNNYILQDICDYILALPANQRTIAETDSKWNVVVDPFGS